MLAHGYGVSVFGSPKILFSNVVWGYFVRIIPTINGVLGYSIATLCVLVTIGSVLVWSLLRSGVGYIACLSIFGLVLTGPVIFPQFTINAGLLFIGALLCWRMYAQKNSTGVLIAGCTLAFLSFLVRAPQFLLMLIVALPLIPWRSLLASRLTKYAFFALSLSIALSFVIDKQAYQSEEWQAFNELNPARAAFTDYGAGKVLKEHPDIMKRHDFSANDVDLIGHWFFVDPNIANPKTLTSMLTELGPLSTQKNSLDNAFTGVQTLWHPRLWISFCVAIILLFLMPSWKVAVSWGLCILAVFSIGLLGRPGVLHVYVTLVSLLLIAPFLTGRASGWRMHLGVCILFVAMLTNAWNVFAESKRFSLEAQKILADVPTFPNTPVVIWGGTFPYDAVYPVLGASTAAMSYRHYGLGTSTLAPYTVAYEEQKAGRGLTDILVAKGGMPVMAHPIYLKMLEIYCQERLHGKLNELSSQKYGATELRFIQCETTN